MSTLETIRRFIIEDIVHTAKLDLRPSDRLIDRGYLTSLDVVNLVVFLEQRFDVAIDPDDVTEEHFQTLDSIVNLVERQRGAQPVG